MTEWPPFLLLLSRTHRGASCPPPPPNEVTILLLERENGFMLTYGDPILLRLEQLPIHTQIIPSILVALYLVTSYITFWHSKERYPTITPSVRPKHTTYPKVPWALDVQHFEDQRPDISNAILYSRPAALATSRFPQLARSASRSNKQFTSKTRNSQRVQSRQARLTRLSFPFK